MTPAETIAREALRQAAQAAGRGAFLESQAYRQIAESLGETRALYGGILWRRVAPDAFAAGRAALARVPGGPWVCRAGAVTVEASDPDVAAGLMVAALEDLEARGRAAREELDALGT